MQRLRAFFCLLALIWGLAGVAFAQDDILEKGMQDWNDLAQRAEAAIGDEDSDQTLLDGLRAEIVEFREEFDIRRNENADRIAAVREQIAALGAPPEDETLQPESDEVAAEREVLNAELTTLLTPVQQAEAAFLRANSLVSRIDQVLRDRNTRKLLSVSPSPLNPANWTVAATDIRIAIGELIAESGAMRNQARGANLREDLAVSALLAVLGMVLILQGRRWSRRIVNWLRNYGARGFGIWQFVVSLLRVILPVAGIVLLLTAAMITGILGPRTEEILTIFAFLVMLMLGFRWVSERVFARDEDEALILLSEADRRRARWYVSLMTLIIVLSGLIQGILLTGETAAGTLPVVAFPFFLVISFCLYRLGRMMRGYTEEVEPSTPEAEARTSSLSRFVRQLGTGAVIVAAVSPLAMAAGYFELASALQRPYVISLAVLGLVMALQRFGADVYGAITRQGIAARHTLFPVLFGMLLVLLSLPVLALVWGARMTDLTELWTSVGQGFAIGDVRISPTDFMWFAVIFTAGYVITRLVQGTLRTNVLPKTRLDVGGQNAIVSGLGYVGIFLAALAAITGAGIDLSSLAIVAGALSVGIGFGLQNIVSNFVSGIILLIERPISEGDWIEVAGGQMGYVRDISVRSTRIETFDRTDVIVPNADLVSGMVTNYTRGNTVGRVIVPVGVAYGTDTRKVEAILKEIAQAQPMALALPAPTAYFVNFGADALEFEIRCFLRDVNWILAVKSDINHAIAARFAEEGIEIPFAQRDLWLRNPESLQNGPGPEETPA